MAPVHLPPFEGGEWLDGDPPAPGDLLGQVVLVNFWTLTCINWLRQAPYVRAWSRAYRGDGLVVVGVHTPEFTFEHDIDLVRRATAERDIDYRVVVDNDYAIWSAFANHYWPALYIADRHGLIRDERFGEGGYEQSEGALQRLLGVQRPPVLVAGRGVEAPADWENLRTPETYLGYRRSESFASPGLPPYDAVGSYSIPSALPLNHWALGGDWTINREYVDLHRAGGRIAFRFHARDVHLVLAPGRDPVPFHVVVGGEPPGPSHGMDVGDDGRGLLLDGRLYQLVRACGDVRERTVEITFHEPGARAYAFTFG